MLRQPAHSRPMALRTEPVRLRVNGVERTVDAEPGITLGDVLRDILKLKGTRFGCGAEQCGACFVLVDGETRFACTTEAASVAGKSVTTVEGLGSPEAPHALQSAFLAEQAAQCGYCINGMIMSAKALLDRNPRPSENDVREALAANLCRCGTHNRIVRAVLRAASEMGRT